MNPIVWISAVWMENGLSLSSLTKRSINMSERLQDQVTYFQGPTIRNTFTLLKIKYQHQYFLFRLNWWSVTDNKPVTSRYWHLASTSCSRTQDGVGKKCFKVKDERNYIYKKTTTTASPEFWLSLIALLILVNHEKADCIRLP